MALVRSFENDEYSPEYGTLVLREPWPAPATTPPTGVPDRLVEHGTALRVSGTFVAAGAGWLYGTARDGYHRVTLELHDGAPGEDWRAGWDEVAETPYLSAAGAVGLTMMTGAPTGADLALGDPGRYRVRVACRRGGADGDRWLLRFWPVAGPGELPRWLLRAEPATRPPQPGWDRVLPGAVREMTFMLGSASGGRAGATTDELAAQAIRLHRPRTWLDDPLWTEPPERPPTGHADLDTAAERQRQVYATYQAGEQARFAEVAAQLGVPVPTTRREALGLLVAAGLLRLAGDRYHLVADPPRALDVLDLPPEQAAVLRRQDSHTRYDRLAGDLASIVAWSPDEPAVSTVDDLAPRVLASPGEVAAALRHAAERRLLAVDGDPGDPSAALRLRALPPEPPAAQRPQRIGSATSGGQTATARRGPVAGPEPEALPAAASTDRLDATRRARATLRAQHAASRAGQPELSEAERIKRQRESLLEMRARADTARGDHTRQPDPGHPATPVPGQHGMTVGRVVSASWAGARQEEDPPPFGAPPQAGLVTGGGVLVVWRDGEPVELAAVGAQPRQAVETAYGTVVVPVQGPAVLIGPDGSVRPLGTDDWFGVARSEDGRFLAATESHFGRRPRHLVHLVDLATGATRQLPKDPEEIVGVTAVHGGAVYVSRTVTPDRTLRWVPGSEPETLPYRVFAIDPLSGTIRTADRAGILLIAPDGGRRSVRLDPGAMLAPGGTRLYTFRHQPPAITLFDPARGAADPTVHWLPPYTDLSPGPGHPVWESPDALILRMRQPSRQLASALSRVDVHTGQIEQVPTFPPGGHGATVVTPLLWR